MNDFLISHDRIWCKTVPALSNSLSITLLAYSIVFCADVAGVIILCIQNTSSVSPAGLHYSVAQHGPDQSVYTLLRTWRHCAARGAWSAQDGTSASGPASAATSRQRGPCEHRKKQFGVLGIFGNTNAVLIYINIHLSISTTISVTICRIFGCESSPISRNVRC